MGKQKLTPTKVRRIKKLLIEGEMTKTAIGQMFGVTRSQVCKINKGMTEPEHPNSRWSEVKI
jgi:DNA-directed RNA polymerase specialized sigma subunit